MAIPTFQAAGTGVGSDTGTVSPAWPAHLPYDIGLLLVETSNEPTVVLDAQGFGPVTNGELGVGSPAINNSTRIQAYWSRASTSAMPAPTVDMPGNHVYARIITFRGCAGEGVPWDFTAADTTGSSDVSVTIPGGVTKVSECLVVAIVAHHSDTAAARASEWMNASLANVTERIDAGTALGNGGGIGAATGELAAAGPFVASTATLAVGATQARLTIALRPPPVFPVGATDQTDGQIDWVDPQIAWVDRQLDWVERYD